jgi:SAM-dependent methyltransferase
VDKGGDFMHGHRKKALFFIKCLDSHARGRRLSPASVEVLDVGCGNGLNVSLPVAQRGFNVTGIDLHGPSIEAARSRQSLANLRFVQASFEDFHADRLFDVVILSDVLEHVRDPDGMLRWATRQLNLGGELLISVPNGYGPFEIEQFLVRRGVLAPLLWLTRKAVGLGAEIKHLLVSAPEPGNTPSPLVCNEDSPHIQFFSLRRFERLLGRNDLIIERRANGAWFGGDLTYFLFYFVPQLVPITLRIADVLPPTLVSTWYFRCRRSSGPS